MTKGIDTAFEALTIEHDSFRFDHAYINNLSRMSQLQAAVDQSFTELYNEASANRYYLDKSYKFLKHSSRFVEAMKQDAEMMEFYQEDADEIHKFIRDNWKALFFPLATQVSQEEIVVEYQLKDRSSHALMEKIRDEVGKILGCKVPKYTYSLDGRVSHIQALQSALVESPDDKKL